MKEFRKKLEELAKYMVGTDDQEIIDSYVGSLFVACIEYKELTDGKPTYCDQFNFGRKDNVCKAQCELCKINK
ncbi:MAG: hypothetical protein WD512_04745 [Candidatus Paceibacterota bacterium]